MIRIEGADEVIAMIEKNTDMALWEKGENYGK